VNNDEPPVPVEQTVFVYMPWSTDLLSYFETNLTDMESAMAQMDMRGKRVVVFLMTSPDEATLFELKTHREGNVRPVLKRYYKPAFTTEEGITSIFNDMKSVAPAGRYALIVGSHGMGWIPVSAQKSGRAAFGQRFHWEGDNVRRTRFFGGLSTAYQTDITTFSAALRNAELKMEYILFDDCYMSTIEVAYELRDVTDHLIGCPTEVMIYGYPYHELGQYLIGDIDYAKICDRFITFYENYKDPYGTIGVTNCCELDALAAIMKEINGQYTFDASLRPTIQRMDGYNPVIFFDCADYVRKLCSDEQLFADFTAQMERVVPAGQRAHTSQYYTALGGGSAIPVSTFSGITISDPSINTLCESKEQTAWYKATH
jgi:hypothetical protein